MPTFDTGKLRLAKSAIKVSRYQKPVDGRMFNASYDQVHTNHCKDRKEVIKAGSTFNLLKNRQKTIFTPAPQREPFLRQMASWQSTKESNKFLILSGSRPHKIDNETQSTFDDLRYSSIRQMRQSVNDYCSQTRQNQSVKFLNYTNVRASTREEAFMSRTL